MSLGFDRKVIWLLLASFLTNHSARLLAPLSLMSKLYLRGKGELGTQTFSKFRVQIKCTLNLCFKSLKCTYQASITRLTPSSVT